MPRKNSSRVTDLMNEKAALSKAAWSKTQNGKTQGYLERLRHNRPRRTPAAMRGFRPPRATASVAHEVVQALLDKVLLACLSEGTALRPPLIDRG